MLWADAHLASPGSSAITPQGNGMSEGAGAGGIAVLVLSVWQDPPPPPDELLVSLDPPLPPVVLVLPEVPAVVEVLSGPEEYEEQATGMTAMDAAATVAIRIEGIVFISKSPVVYDDRLGSLFKSGRA